MQKLNIKINSTDTQPFFPINKNTARSNLHKSIKLGSLIKNKKQALTPVSKATWVSSEEILSSVSRKLYPDPIQIISRCNYDTESLADRKQISISCLGEFQTLSLINFMPEFRQSVTYQQMLRKVIRSGKKSLISDVHSNKGQKKGCFQLNCSIKQKWIKNVIFYQREIKNLYILKEKMPNIQQKCLQQINKDIHRSFPQNMFPKTKLTVYHAGSQKVNMIQILKTVLKLYSLLDTQIGYVQGINLVAAAIVTHMKEVEASFIYLKELMNYGKLRLLYVDDFSLLKKQGNLFFQLHLKDQIPDLYEHFKQCHIEPLMLIPSYYTTLFASVVDINYMHIIINQYFQNGVCFLHKFFLALLLFMKQDLLSSEEQTIVKLGSSYIKNLKIPWDEVINITQGFKDL